MITEFKVLTAPNYLRDKLLSKSMLDQQHPQNPGQPLHVCQSVIIPQLRPKPVTPDQLLYKP